MSTPGFPATVTVPGFFGCFSCRWLPRCRATSQPFCLRILSASRTFNWVGGFRCSGSYCSGQRLRTGIRANPPPQSIQLDRREREQDGAPTRLPALTCCAFCFRRLPREIVPGEPATGPLPTKWPRVWLNLPRGRSEYSVTARKDSDSQSVGLRPRCSPSKQLQKAFLFHENRLDRPIGYG